MSITFKDVERLVKKAKTESFMNGGLVGFFVGGIAGILIHSWIISQ